VALEDMGVAVVEKRIIPSPSREKARKRELIFK